ncbi:hypothetical protein EDC04DRAFT_2605587 [Pisolithus marmoratus]|nr:hypothetical protein EDC04DRAFT_2605587 [Pisolithus marmoratus]
MHLQWFRTQAESFPLTPLNHNSDSSKEHTLLSSSTVALHAMNVDDSWSDIDATSPTISKPSKPPIDAHAIIASTSGVAEKSVPRAIINRRMPATTQKATVENPRSEAAANTAVVIRSMESNLVDNPRSVAATNTAVVSSMGSNSGKRPALVDTAQVDTPPLSDNACKPFISSQHNSALAQVQGELEGGARAVRAYEKHADGNVKFAQLAEEHGQLQRELGNRDRIIEQQRAALEDLQAGFGMLQAKLDHEITRVNAEKEAQFVALTQKFEGALCQVEASRSQIQMQKEAEVVALAQKFEDALRQVEVSKSQIQAEKETEVAALAQKFEDALRQVKVSKSQIQTEKETEVAALAQKFEGLVGLIRRTCTPRRKVNSRKYHQFAMEHVRELLGNIFSVTRDKDFLSHESPSHEVVMSFTEGNGPGPDPINLQWDFTGPVSSLWNQAVIEILLDKLHALCAEEKWTTKPRSNEYWKEAIKQKFNRIKVIWTKGRPKRLETDYTEGYTEGSKMARGTRDVELWQWLSDVVDHLGTDGMSSEDSEEEDMQTIFRVRSMPWRCDIDKELRFIDSKHKDRGISSPKGAKPVKRIRPSNPFPSARQPVCGLPATFYKPEWLEGNPTFKSDKVFEWSQFIVQGI